MYIQYAQTHTLYILLLLQQELFWPRHVLVLQSGGGGRGEEQAIKITDLTTTLEVVFFYFRIHQRPDD